MRSSHSQQAANSAGEGCLPLFSRSFILAPLVVLVFGCLMAAFTLNDPSLAAGASGLGSQSAVFVDAGADQAGQALPAGAIAPLFTAEVQIWSGHILRWAQAAGVPADLAATVMQIESCGDPLARSRSGAASLFQVMPFHFAVGEDPYDTETNARRGMDYLRRSLETAGGDPALALAGYNGGIGVIGLDRSAWAAETVRYEYWGSGIYADAQRGAADSARLQEWLEAGGASLCRQARARLGIGE